MNGLVGDYGSDSDGEGPALQTSPAKQANGPPPQTASNWIECMDTTTGYPYFWNTKTNEVRWEKPAEMASQTPQPPSQPQPPQKQTGVTPQQLPSQGSSKPDPVKRESISSYPPPQAAAAGVVTAVTAAPKQVQKTSKSQKSSAKASVVFGPSLPPVKPEDVALAKIKRFEENLAASVCKDLEKETPPDWLSGDKSMAKPKAGIYAKPFAWKKKEPAAASVAALEDRAKSNPIAMIAGYDSDSHDDEQHKTAKKSSPRKMIQVRVKKAKSDESGSHLKPVHSAFRQGDADGSASSDGGGGGGEDAASDHRPQEKKRRKTNGSTSKKASSAVAKGYDTSAGPSYKKSIDQVGELLCDKLEFLRVDKIEISPLKLLAVQTETIFEAWTSGALSPGYMQKYLTGLAGRLLDIESEHLAPPGWRAVWMR